MTPHPFQPGEYTTKAGYKAEVLKVIGHYAYGLLYGADELPQPIMCKWDPTGCAAYKRAEYDLKPKTMWINVYASAHFVSPYKSREEADVAALAGRIACVEFAPGQGL